MRSSSQPRLALEQLEPRCQPSLTVVFYSGNLFLYGLPQNNPINITQQASGMFQVMDGGNSLGIYRVTHDITTRLANKPITLTLITQPTSGVAGSVNFNPGNGAGDTVQIEGTAAGVQGQIGGNLTVNTGRGDGDTVDLSLTGNNIGGTVNLTATDGMKTYLLNPFAAPLKIGGDLNAVLPGSPGTSTLTLGGSGQPVTVGGTMRVNGPGNGARAVDVGTGAFVGGNFQYNGGSGSNSVVIDGTVGGNVSVTEGSTNNTFNVTGTAVVGGNVTFADASGSVNNVFFFTGSSVGGNAALNVLGSGNYFFQGSITGNEIVNSGNGDTSVFSQGSVGGGVLVHVGNGTDSLVQSDSAGGPVTYTSGNGNNNVQVGGTNSFALIVNFGSGSNAFTYNAGTSVGSAFLNFGVGSSGDTYNDNGVIVTWPQTIINFNP